MRPTSVYSQSFFDTFAATIPAHFTDLDVDAAVRFAPPADFPRLLDIGCGVGRVTRGLASRGFQVTGIDASVDALCRARRVTDDGRFVALDFRHLGQMRWTFDVVTSYWNSIGFGSHSDDVEVLRSVERILRPGGRLLLDLYHPVWLEAHTLHGVIDPRGATVDRWVEHGRSCHRFQYPDGATDTINFLVYQPHEMVRVLTDVGLAVDHQLVCWSAAQTPGPEHPRYQLVAVKR